MVEVPSLSDHSPLLTPLCVQIHRADSDQVARAAAMIDALPLVSQGELEAVQNPALQRAFLAIEVGL